MGTRIEVPKEVIAIVEEGIHGEEGEGFGEKGASEGVAEAEGGEREKREKAGRFYDQRRKTDLP